MVSAFPKATPAEWQDIWVKTPVGSGLVEVKHIQHTGWGGVGGGDTLKGGRSGSSPRDGGRGRGRWGQT